MERKTNYSILIVDDEKVACRGLARMLSPEYRVYTACNGQEGLEILDRNIHIDIVICDIMMPVMDGRETIEQIRRTNRKIPIIVLSGGFFDERIQETIDSHATCFFMKPLDIEALMNSIAKALAPHKETAAASHPEQ